MGVEIKNKLIMLWKQCCDNTTTTASILSDYRLPIKFDKGGYEFYGNPNIDHDYGRGGLFYNTYKGSSITIFKVDIGLNLKLTYRSENIKRFYIFNSVKHVSNYDEVYNYYHDNFIINDFDKKFGDTDHYRISFDAHFISYKSFCILLKPEEYKNLLKYEKDKNSISDIDELMSELNILSADEYKDFLEYKEKIKDANTR